MEKPKTKLHKFEIVGFTIGDYGTVRAVDHLEALLIALSDCLTRYKLPVETWEGSGWLYSVKRKDHKTAKYFSEI